MSQVESLDSRLAWALGRSFSEAYPSKPNNET